LIKDEDMEKSLIKGHIVDVCTIEEYVDLDGIVDKIYAFKDYFNNREDIQKAILGILTDYHKQDIPQRVLVKVSNKITNRLMA